MPVSKKEGPKSAPATASSSRIEEQPQDEELNPLIAKDLLSDLKTRLGGGLHGSFFEAGTRLDDDKRHEQLPHLFKVVGLLERYIAIHEAKETIKEDSAEGRPGRMAARPNNNMIATINSIVDAKLLEKTRDQNIKIERQTAEIDKVRAERDAFEVKVKKLNAPSRELKDRLEALEERIDSSVRNVERKLNAMIEQCNGERIQFGADTRTNLENLQKEIEQLRAESCEAITTANVQFEKIGDLSSRLTIGENQYREHAFLAIGAEDSLRTRLEGVEQQVEDAEQHVEGVKLRLEQHKSKGGAANRKLWNEVDKIKADRYVNFIRIVADHS